MLAEIPQFSHNLAIQKCKASGNEFEDIKQLQISKYAAKD